MQQTISGDNLQPGTIVDGRFKLLRLLGQGGMGVVYAATHLNMNRTVAIKMLRRDSAQSPELILRFRNEARVLSSLEHPHIVKILAVGVDGEGKPYIAMEMIEGIQLSQHIRANGPMRWREAIPLFKQLCEALAYAHQRSVVHRDIKPSNVMLSGTTSNGQVQSIKVIDFGIVKLLKAGAPQLTLTNMLPGSAFYLSPEQLQGRAADTRSDIYSVGCSFFEALTGAPPFVGDTIYDTINKQCHEQAALVNVANHDADIPDDLQFLIDWMMQKEVARRPASMQIVADCLEKVGRMHALDRMEIGGTHVDRVTRAAAPRWTGKSRRLLATAATAAGGVLLILGGNNLPLPTGASPPPRYEQYVGNILDGVSAEESQLLSGIKLLRNSGAPPAQLVEKLSALAELYTLNGRPLETELVLERTLSVSERAELETDRLLLFLGGSYLVSGKYDRAETALKNSIKESLARGRFPGDQKLYLVNVYYDTNRYKSATAVLDCLLDADDAAITETDLSPRFTRNCVDAYCASGDYRKASSALKKLSPFIADPRFERAVGAEIEYMLGKRGKAELTLKQLDAEFGDEENEDSARLHVACARVFQRQHRWAAACLEYDRAVDVLSRHYEKFESAAHDRNQQLPPAALCVLRWLDSDMLRIMNERLARCPQTDGVAKQDGIHDRIRVVGLDRDKLIRSMNARTKLLPSYLTSNGFLPH